MLVIFYEWVNSTERKVLVNLLKIVFSTYQTGMLIFELLAVGRITKEAFPNLMQLYLVRARLHETGSELKPV